MTSPRPYRPVLSGQIERLVQLNNDLVDSPGTRLELAHLTAAAVVKAGRNSEAHVDLVRLADAVGLETLTELWRGAATDTLPGALWTLYVLRTWCVHHGEEVARLYQAGRGLAPVDEVVAGAADGAGPQEMIVLADAVLTGLHHGDFGVALERAAAFFRIVAVGREFLAPDGSAGQRELDWAARNRSCADSLTRAARLWRAGTLN